MLTGTDVGGRRVDRYRCQEHGRVILWHISTGSYGRERQVHTQPKARMIPALTHTRRKTQNHERAIKVAATTSSSFGRFPRSAKSAANAFPIEDGAGIRRFVTDERLGSRTLIQIPKKEKMRQVAINPVARERSVAVPFCQGQHQRGRAWVFVL